MTRVLVIAESANPEWVSVPLVGWSLAAALGRVCDVHLVTQVRNRAALERAGWVEGREFTAIDSERLERPAVRLATWLRGGAGAGWTVATAFGALTYPYFERLVWKRFGAAVRGGAFDVVHRVTPLSPAHPSSLASRCRRAGVPFVLGPLNGGVPWPRGFADVRRQEKEWLSYVRAGYKWLPGYWRTRASASAILIGSRDTWRQMPARFHDKCFYVAENAIDPARFTRRRLHRAELPLRAIFVGRLVPYKGADMLIEAAAPLVRAGKWRIEIVGDGPQMPALRALVARERLEAGVTLAGWTPHTELQDRLAASDVLAFPSIREFGGGVALEAMAVGVVPIVPDYGGLGELVTPATGFLVPMGDRGEMVARYRAILTQLAEQPERIDQRSLAAQRRVEAHYTWEAKARQILSIYDWLLHPGRPRPTFAMPTPDFPEPIRVAAHSG